MCCISRRPSLFYFFLYFVFFPYFFLMEKKEISVITRFFVAIRFLEPAGWKKKSKKGKREKWNNWEAPRLRTVY